MYHVLYVDDEPDLLEITKLYLEVSHEFIIDTATSAQELLNNRDLSEYDAIISDYQMPGMDGITFLKEIRARFGTIPFILFTGRGREEVVIQAINNGADFYLQKGDDLRSQFAELSHKIRSAASRKRAEDALRKNEEKYRHLIEHSHEAIVMIQDGMPRLVNHQTIEFTGYSEDELLSMSISALIHPYDHAMVMERYQKRMKGEGVPSYYSFRLSSKDGSTRWVEMSAVATDWEGRPATLNFLTDITGLKRAEMELEIKHDELMASYEQLTAANEELRGQFDELAESERIIRSSEERLIMAQEIGRTGCWEYNVVTDTIWGSAEALRLFGFPGAAGDFPIDDIDACTPERERVHQALVDLISEGKEYNLEYDINPADGSAPRVIHSIARLEKDTQGNPLRARGVIRDITERKQQELALLKNTEDLYASYEELTAAEEELRANVDELAQQEMSLRKSEERYRLIDDASLDFIYSYDRAGRFTSANRSLCAALRLRTDQVLGRTHPELGFPVAECREWDELHRRVFETGTTVTSLTSTPMPDGTFHHYEVVLNLLHDGVGTIIGIAGTTRDITERKQMEEALQESKRQLNAMTTNIPGVVFRFSVNPDGTTGFDYISERSRQILGLENDPVTFFDRVTEGIVPKDRKRFHSTIQHAISTKTLWTFESQYLKPSGKKIWMSAVSSPVIENDRLIFDGVIFNNTERKRAEEALHQANKKLKLLSGITRHDINNQLTILQGYLTILETEQPNPPLNEYFQKVATAAERISAMIQFTKEYESIGVNAPAWQDCRTLVDTAAQQVQLGEVMVKNDLPAGTEVFADPLIVRVFYNLMDNAVRYGGKITTLRFSAPERDGDQVVVCEDDGDGVPVEEKEQIFNRGFGKNTGLGLALSREILDITGITIHETGETGKGSRFEMGVPKGMWRIAGKRT